VPANRVNDSRKEMPARCDTFIHMSSWPPSPRTEGELYSRASAEVVK
jgi:hypothetical protein